MSAEPNKTPETKQNYRIACVRFKVKSEKHSNISVHVMLIWKLVTRTDSLNFTHFLTVHVVVCNLRKPIKVLLITVSRMLRKTVLGKTCPADFCFLLIAHRSPKLWVSRSSFKPSFFERGLKSSSDERE